VSRAPARIDTLIKELIDIRNEYGDVHVELCPELMELLDGFTVPTFRYDEEDKQVYVDFDEEELGEEVKTEVPLRLESHPLLGHEEPVCECGNMYRLCHPEA
jgi:hypothetical protein